MGIGNYFKGKMPLLLVLTIVAWVFGIFQGYYGSGDFLIFPKSLPISVIAVTVFAFSFLFFGFLAPFILFFVGVYTSGAFLEAGVISPKLILLTFSSFAAVYASLRLGNALLEDMTGTGNFNSAARASLVAVLAAVFVAAIWDIGFL